jgi:glycosyltransferase involved in cell wall biosynthesis
MMTFTGKVSYGKAPLYLSLGDLAVTTKTSATEGSGKVLNYMAMALPVVAYDTPVHREYLVDLGIYSPAGQVGSLAAAIGNLADDRGRRHDLGQKLRRRAAENYSWRRAGEQISKLYNSLTNR